MFALCQKELGSGTPKQTGASQQNYFPRPAHRKEINPSDEQSDTYHVGYRLDVDYRYDNTQNVQEKVRSKLLIENQFLI